MAVWGESVKATQNFTTLYLKECMWSEVQNVWIQWTINFHCYLF